MAEMSQRELFEMGMSLLKAAGARVRDGRGAPLDAAAIANGDLARTQARRRSMIVSPSGENYMIEGVGPENWFGPFEPMMPLADKPGPQGAVGRRYDYPVGVNINFRPRAEEPITFATLRHLGDALDLLRLVIETRKDQIASFDWEIVPKDGKADTETEAIKRVTGFLERPSREHGWDEWIRQVIEDVLVVDGVCIYPRKTRGGKPYSIDLIDPGTIKRLIDVEGRTPEPPSPAYQQVLKGVPAVDYTADELVYWMRNRRSWKNYGYSPVEQVMVTVNIALRRQMYQLQYYTEGNLPDALIGVSETWSPEQIKEFQDQWDAQLYGQQGERRKVKFMPKWDSILSPKDTEVSMSDMFDEWLARVICYAFSVPPIALVKMVNRAAGQQIADAAHEEGLMPFLRWLAARLNHIIWEYLGEKSVKFAWKMQDEVDPAVQANIRASDVKSGIITIDEAREQLGMEPMDITDLIVMTQSGPVPIKEALDKAKEDIKNPPDPFAAFGGRPSFPPKHGAEGEQQGKDGEQAQPGQAKQPTPRPPLPGAEKAEVHVHLGDVNVRVPPSDLPDVHVHSPVNVSADLRQRHLPEGVTRKTIVGKRDPLTGDLFGEVYQREGGPVLKREKVKKRVRAWRDPETGELMGEITEEEAA